MKSNSLIWIYVLLLAFSCKKGEVNNEQYTSRIVEINSDETNRLSFSDEDSTIVLESDDIGYSGKMQKIDLKVQYSSSLKPPKIDGNELRATHISINKSANIAYVSYNTEGNTYLGGLDIIDISNTKKPKILTTLKFETTDISACSYSSSNDKLYLATASSDEGFSSPSILEEINLSSGKYSKSADNRIALSSYVCTDVKVINNNVYAVTGNTGGLYKSALGIPSSTLMESIHDARSIAHNTNHIAVMSGTPAVIKLYNISTGVLEKTFNPGGANIAESKSHIIMDDKYIYMASGDEGTKVIDVSSGNVEQTIENPNNKNLDDHLEVCNTVAVYGDYMFSGNGEAGVYVSDLTNLKEKTVVIGKFKLRKEKSVNHLLVHEKNLFIARGKEGFIIARIVE